MTERSHGARGMSLIEVLVATAVMSVAIVIALGLYDASRKAFAKGENATEQQESVRIAFDELTSDLRMMGHDVNPDGNPGRPDEQLEGALAHAIILRSDLDAADPTESLTPETALAGGAFSTVSTGNDEIVAYVLSRPNGTGPDTITFQADVQEAARDGIVEPVTISNVVLNPTAPPYTLYRITLNNNPATYGSPAFIVRTPLAENVRDLSFVYHNVAGTFVDSSASIPETPVARERRSGLFRVEVSIVGMTRQQDLRYRDTADPIAPSFRKFELKGDVTPRNMRLKGMQDIGADRTPPSKPATPLLTPGHCGGLIVRWTPNAPSEGVAQYMIYWGPSGGNRYVPGPPYFLDGLSTTPAAYTVTIEAYDAEGNRSVPSDPAPATTTSNVNVPSTPATFATSIDQPYRVMVSWGPVTTNTSNQPAADPIAPTVRDLAGYRLYVDGNQVVNESVLSAGSAPPYYHLPVVACRRSSYEMTAVDRCGVESARTPVRQGMGANPGVLPRPATNVQAQYVVSPTTARIRWDAITEDVADQEIMIDRYNIYRSEPVAGGGPPSAADWGPTPIATVAVGPYIYNDNSVPSIPAGHALYYRVSGADDCGNVSMSTAERLECTFAGDVDIDAPRYNQRVSGMVTTRVSVSGGGGETYNGVRITYVHSTQGLQRTYTSPSPGPNWTDDDWRALPTGRYTITATVTKADGCQQTAVTRVWARNP